MSLLNMYVVFFFSNATISAPPTTNMPGSTIQGDAPKSALITTTGTTSKIIHPPEDISLEELRARKSKFSRKIATAVAAASTHSSQQQLQKQQNTHSISNSSVLATTTASMVSAAVHHEVSKSKMDLFLLLLSIVYIKVFCCCLIFC